MMVEESVVVKEACPYAGGALGQTGGRLRDVLLNGGLLSPEDLGAVLSIHLNVPFIDLKRHVIQPAALAMVPETLDREHTLIPVDVVGDALVVAMADPEDVQTIEDLRAQVKMRVEVTLALPSDIKRAIGLSYRARTQPEEQAGRVGLLDGADAGIVSEVIARMPIAQSLDMILTQAIRDRASDIHLEPQKDGLRVRYRIDGVLHDVPSLPVHVHVPVVSRVKILADMNIAEQRRPRDGQFSFAVGDREVDVRTSTMETTYGERVTLRLLDRSLALFALPELGLLPDPLERLREMLKSAYGMVLVGGPTGSGKTTTLYASLTELDSNQRNIMTVEDPVEYHFKDISQAQVNPKAGLTFATGLRAILRHDPDVILVGEVRDRDTAMTAAQAALTGHLVLSSIHANDAVGVLFRLMDLGVEPYLVGSTLVGVVAQRMVRRLCTHCRAVLEPSGQEYVACEEEMGEAVPVLYGPSECNLCVYTGYRGRTALFEVLVMTPGIRNTLLSGGSAAAVRAQALSEGMVTMRRDGMKKAREGITSVSEVLRSVFCIT